MLHKVGKVLIPLLVLLLSWAGAFYLAQSLTDSVIVTDFVSRYGYIGIFLLAIVSGFNVLLPIPAATFVPLYVGAGLSLLTVIIVIAVGTTLADLFGYFIGNWSRTYAKDHYPRTYKYVYHLQKNHHILIIPSIFLYATFVPFPNEALIIPLALAGVPLRSFLTPLIAGNILHQVILVYGVHNLFMTLW